MVLATVHDRYSDEEIARFYAEGVWTNETLFTALEAQVDQRGDKVFLFDSTTQFTYRQVHDEALRLAAGLVDLGVRPGDRVAVQIPNWAEFAVIATALTRLGAIMVPIMPIYRSDECRYILEAAEVKAVFTADTYKDFGHAEMFLQLRESNQDLQHVILVRPSPQPPAGAVLMTEVRKDIEPAAAEELVGPGVGPDDPFVIVFSSGTTALPKGCLHTFNTVSAGARLLGKGWAYTDADVQFGPSPVTHTTGLVTSVVLPLIHGASSHIMEAWEPSEGLVRIAKYRCTAAVTATAFLQMLLEAFDPTVHDASSMRFWCSAGAPIPASVVEEVRQAIPSMQVLSLYGRTENITTTMCTVFDDPQRSLTSDGKALPGQEVKVVDAAGNEVARGQEGDIAYRGAMNSLEYINQPEATAEMYTADGFSKSGDLGVMDADGYVRVTGRIKDIVIRGGLNISVRQIEDLLTAHPKVSAIAVVGMPDERMGEKVCAYMVPAKGSDPLTLEEIKTYLLDRGLAIQKVPERLEVVDSLPMTATGKIQKHYLRKDIADKLMASVD
jgi:cyclohexanecarboxylate-CoA ligase